MLRNRRPSFLALSVGDDHLVARLDQPLELEDYDRLVVRPAALEELGPVDSDVGGAVEGEVVGQALLDDPAIAALVGAVDDLVDELRLMVFPVMIGGGKRPFPESRQKKTVQADRAPRRSTRASPCIP